MSARVGYFQLIEALENRTLFATTVMPLGDSITASATGHASYRYWLWKSLQNAGYTDVNFVGSQVGVDSGSPQFSDFDQDHEGHWGWRADEINAQIAGWANTYRPDVVMMHLGSNDLFQGQSVSSTITDLGAIIDKLRAANPNVTVLMAQLIPNTTTSVSPLNSSIATLAGQKNTSSSRVIAVDQFTGFNASSDTWDGIHPNQGGEQKMSSKWYSALTPFLQTAPPPPPPPPGGTYLSDLNPTFTSNGWGTYERDKSNGEQATGDGRTITLNGTTYAKGLGVHAASELRYALGGQYTQFVADIGMDDEVGNSGSVVFQVFDNLGNKLYDSGTMNGSTATKSININVTGKQEIRLIVTNAGNGNDSDHGDWASARLIAAPVVNAPVINTFTGGSINEGSTYTATGSFTDTETGPWTATVNYGDGTGNLPLTLNADKTFSLSHVYSDNGNFVVTVAVSNGNASGNKTATVAVANVAPSIVMPPNATIAFGNPFTGAGSFSDPGTLDTFTGTVDYGDGAGAVALTLNANKTFNLSKTYSQGGTFTITVTIKDKDNGTKTATTAVTITGAPVQTTTYLSDLSPTFNSNGWGSYERDKSNGEQATGDGTTLKINGANFSKGLGVHAASELRYNLAKQYARFKASVGVDDETNGYGSVRFLVYGDGVLIYDSGVTRARQAAKVIDIDVSNVTELKLVANDGGDGNSDDHGDWADAKLTKTAPAFSIAPITNRSLLEGGAFTTTGSFSDPNAGTWTATVNYGDGGGAQALTLNPDKTFDLNHVYADNGSYTVTVSINNGTTSVSTTALMSVANVAPAITLPTVFSSGPTFAQGGSFADPGTLDTWTATVDYGDGTGVKTLALNPNKTFSLSNAYVYNGAYAVKVTIVDKDGGSSTSTETLTVTGGQNRPLTYLSDLSPTSASNGWGSYERDKSNGEQATGDGRAIKINGVTYAKGLGVHAASELRYNLAGGSYQNFSTDYGVDDEENGAGSVHFLVYLDGVLVFDSGTVRGGQAAKSFSISVAGKSELKLVVSNNGDGSDSDHADWANARLSS